MMWRLSEWTCVSGRTVCCVVLGLLTVLSGTSAGQTCDKVATEKYLCWQDNEPLYVHLNCPIDHQIDVYKVKYYISDNSCPVTGLPIPTNQYHCEIDDLTQIIHTACEGKQTCTQIVTKKQSQTTCIHHSGSHYLDISHFCVPNFKAIDKQHVREIHMCESLEWSGYYAHILSHHGANDANSYTYAIGCSCQIKKYNGTNLEIRSLKFRATETYDTCTEYVQVVQGSGRATTKICEDNALVWNLGCQTETYIDIKFRAHDSAVGVNYKLAIQVAQNQMFSVSCGIPTLEDPPPAGGVRSPTNPDGFPTNALPVNSSSEKQSQLFGLSMLAGIGIIVAIAVVLIVIVIVGVCLAVRFRKPASSESYRDLVEEQRQGPPPPLPARSSNGHAAGVAVKDLSKPETTDTYNNSTYGKLGRFNHLPEVAEVRMSDLEKKVAL